MARQFRYLDRAATEGLEHPFLTLAISLQFAFAERMSAIIGMKREWVDFSSRRVVWPDSRTGQYRSP
jgi:hypothetical protein